MGTPRKDFKKNDRSRKLSDKSGRGDKKFGGKKFDRDQKPHYKKKSNNHESFRKKEGDEKPFRKKWNSDSREGKDDRKKHFNKEDKPFRKKWNSDKDGDRKKYNRDDKYERKDDRKKKYDNDDKPFRKKWSDGNKFDRKDDRKKHYDKDDKPFRKKWNSDKDGERKKYNREDKFERKEDHKKKYDNDRPFKKDGEDKPFRKKWDGEYTDKSFRSKDSKYGKEKYGDKKDRGYSRKDKHNDSGTDEKKKFKFDPEYKFKNEFKRKQQDEVGDFYDSDEHYKKKRSFDKNKTDYEKLIKKSEKNRGKDEKANDGLIRLNKYIANSGVCSRREADDLIVSGAVKVNGKVVTELGTKINPNDKVQYGGETIKTEKHVYIVVNKPKDYITTMDDPEGRKTVMSLLRGACKERVYPVGRLDRNTTGVLLFTNDGELTRRLTHPKFLVSKMYHVSLDKNFTRDDLETLRNGIELEDGFIKPDQLEFTGDGKNELGIEVHSGRNRIVRRMFEHLGYQVIKLDRVQFAGLTKKDIQRGKYRFLNEKEVGFLKML